MPVKTTLSSWPVPPSAWHRVHVDFAGPVNKNMFFIMVDAFSKWPEIFRMPAAITSAATIKVIREVCGRFGSMDVLVSDNKPQFTSEKFAVFCRGEDIRHIRTPPYHPQSNGQCERFVDTFKRAMKKQLDWGDESLQRFLQMYRATPNPNRQQVSRRAHAWKEIEVTVGRGEATCTSPGPAQHQVGGVVQLTTWG